MDWVTSTFLILLVGLALGVLGTVWADNKYWGKRLQTAVSLQQQLKKQMRQVVRRLSQLQTRSQAQQKALRRQAQEAETLNRQAVALRNDVAQKEQSLETAVSDLQVAHDNLTRVGEYNDTLQKENEAWEAKYSSSEKAMLAIRTQLHNTQGELTAVRHEKEAISEKLLTTSAKLQSMSQLRDKLAAKESELDGLGREKITLEASLTNAKAQIEKLNALAGLLRQQEAANKTLEAELKAAKETANAAEQERELVQHEVLGLRRRVSEGDHVRKRLTAVSQELETTKTEVETLKSKLVAQNHIKQSVLNDKDNLTIIRGIGPAYARRLNEAGISSLIDLAQMSPERVGEIVGVQNWQSRNVQAWIDEAQSLVASFTNS